jgi:hypothetical protein
LKNFRKSPYDLTGTDIGRLKNKENEAILLKTSIHKKLRRNHNAYPCR